MTQQSWQAHKVNAAADSTHPSRAGREQSSAQEQFALSFVMLPSRNGENEYFNKRNIFESWQEGSDK